MFTKQDERRESSKSTSKEDAKKLLRQRLKEIDEAVLTPGEATVGDLLTLYLADMRRNAKKSAASAERNVKLHVKPAFGAVKASKLESEQIERFVDQKLTQGYKPASINRYLSSLQRGYSLGMERNPPLVTRCPKITKLEENNVREGFLDHEQYLALRDALPDHQKLVLVIGYHFGMRSGEILSLRWDQIDWDANLIRLEKKQTKGKQARVAPLYGEVRAWFEHAFSVRDPRCPFIVSYKGEQIESLKTGWVPACVRAGVPGLYVHDLRRTAVRNMVRANIPEKRAMLISGHRTRSVFDRYDIVDERDMQGDGEKLATYLAQMAELSKLRTKVRTVANEAASDSASKSLSVQ
jgi:integrase